MNFIKTFLASILAFVVGTVLVFFFWVTLLFGLAGSMEKSVFVENESILRIDFSELITDAPTRDPFAGIDFFTLESTRQLSLMKVLRTIEAAKGDDRIKGIYLRMNGGGGVAGTAVLEELREAILDFKQSGKFVISYNDTYSQGQYYLASVADKIYIQPEGGMDWSGLAFNSTFYKGLLDKLDIKAEIFRPTACTYKSAVEPFILDKMSSANREQMQALVNSMWRTIAGAVAESRGMSLAELNRITDKLEVVLPEEALKHGFVDSVLYVDQMKGIFEGLGVKPNKKGELNVISLGDYAMQVGANLKNISASQVAIVYADGEILDGNGSGDKVFGVALSSTLAKVRDDENIKAVVLRINSPGGSALASDVIWREMELLKAKKPIIVSMGSYAASGGYYIASPADVIVADKLTLTGSIGVYGMYLNTAEALKNKLGVTYDGVKSNTAAGMGTTGALTALERAAIMRGVDKVYTTFTGHVAAGRNLPIERVLEIAGGRVWSGEDALAIGLIDTYGGLKTAIALAAEKAELGEDFRVVEILDEPTGLMSMIASLNVNIKSAFVRSELGELMNDYKQVQEALTQQGVVMYSPYRLELR